MRIVARQWAQYPDGPTARLLERMVGPLTGIAGGVGVFRRASRDPRFVTMGAELCGVHLLDGRPKPPGSYHIGGNGTSEEEALIKTLSETVERYVQLTANQSFAQRVRYASYRDLLNSGEQVVDAAKLHVHAEAQFRNPQFPFRPFDETKRIGWLEAVDLRTGQRVWAPAQLMLVGYITRSELGEPRIGVGVTTGTASHIDRPRALKNALLELCQLDSVMGHWHSAAVAPRIEFDARTDLVARFMRRVWDPVSRLEPEFYFLPSPDLPGHTVACILRDRDATPQLGVGVGSDSRLDRAMHKALMEGSGVLSLAKMVLFQRIQDTGNLHIANFDGEPFHDLDSNVGYYALPGNSGLIDRKFGAGKTVRASELPEDYPDDPVAFSALVADAFDATGKTLLCLDLTEEPMAKIGFRVVRVWSPDTIPLSLPGAPPLGHRRFADFGGVHNYAPHPYP